MFLPWRDKALYTESPGGDFEGAMSGWAFSYGAEIVDGNESFQVGGWRDESSLVLAPPSNRTDDSGYGEPESRCPRRKE